MFIYSLPFVTVRKLCVFAKIKKGQRRIWVQCVNSAFFGGSCSNDPNACRAGVLAQVMQPSFDTQRCEDPEHPSHLKNGGEDRRFWPHKGFQQ
jgi:hypothetical protein